MQIHFCGWSKSRDEWVAADSDGLQRYPGTGKPESEPQELEWVTKTGLIDAEDQQYEVSKLLRKRRREDGDEYLVRWKGYSKRYDTWEPAENVSQTAIDEFVPPPAKRQREPVGPYVSSVEDPIDASVAATLVQPWLNTVGRKSMALLARQKEAWAFKLLEHMDTCPAWAFKALHAALKQMAADLPAGAPRSPGASPAALDPVLTVGVRATGDHVDEISSVKGSYGGVHVEDRFSIKSSKLVERLLQPHNKLGHGALVVREQNKVAVMLAPPLEFTYRTRRVGDGEDQPEELFVTGHFMMLVPRHGKDPRWVFDDGDKGRADYSNVNKHTYKVALALAAEALGRDKFSPRVLKFLELLT